MESKDKSSLKDHDLPSGLKKCVQEAVEVRLWEVYLTRSRTNLGNILASYSLDNGPFGDTAKDQERVTLRFLKFDWDKTVRGMLVSNNVPFDIIRYSRVDVFQEVSRKKVYVAEDDLNTLFALNTMLETAGYDVIISHSGYPLLEKHLPATDLFILDKRMPDIDGIDLCQHLRAQPATKDTPIVMISASRNFAAKALKAGVDDCLEKPFDMKELLGLVSKHTSRRNRRRHVEAGSTG